MQTMRSTCSFDPMKKSIIQNHLSHKGRVTNLQHEFSEQKQLIKRHLADRVNALRTKVIQTKKRVKVIENEKQLAEDMVTNLTNATLKRQEQVQASKKQAGHLRAELHELEQDCDEIDAFKLQLKFEIE